MLTSDGVRAVVQIGQAILLFTGSAEVWHIVVAAAASAFFVPASTGLMPQVVSPGRLQQANALVTLAERGVCHRSGGIRHPGRRQRTERRIRCRRRSYVFSMITLALIRIDRAVATEVRVVRVGAEAGVVRSRDWLIGSLLVFGISNMAMGSFMVLGPVIVDRELGGAAEWGFIMTVGALGAIVGGAVALRWKPARPLAVGFALMLVGATRAVSHTTAAGAGHRYLGHGHPGRHLDLEHPVGDRAPAAHSQASLSRVSSYDWMVSLAFNPSVRDHRSAGGHRGEVPTLLLASAIGLAAKLRCPPRAEHPEHAPPGG